jgi:hypothetical protein
MLGTTLIRQSLFEILRASTAYQHQALGNQTMTNELLDQPANPYVMVIFGKEN